MSYITINAVPSWNIVKTAIDILEEDAAEAIVYDPRKKDVYDALKELEARV